MTPMSAWAGLLACVRPHRGTLVDRRGAGAARRGRGLAQPLAAREVIEAMADDRSLLTPL
jgi:hypothetical protein